MRIFTLFGLYLVLPAFTIAVPGLQVEQFDRAWAGRYIVTLKSGVSKSSFLETTKTNVTQDWTLINGFACELDGNSLEALRTHQDVESISEDGVVHPYRLVTQNNATWGLSRLSRTQSFNSLQSATALNFAFTYDDSVGTGVDIYIVDTGVAINHTDFGGRARWGATFGPYVSQDLDGHGTHCAGTAAGRQFGVAKNASIIAVKVLGSGENSTGHITDIISGLDWVARSARQSGNPSIASLSLGAPGSNSLDSAVISLINTGVHVVAAAGNDNVDARTLSPARISRVITVGASNIRDQRSSFSNFGPAVDIFAPGETIIGPWIGSPNALMALDGTSMERAAPHVSGLVAYFIALRGNTSPLNMLTMVQNLALTNFLRNIPSGTVNLLAQNGFASGAFTSHAVHSCQTSLAFFPSIIVLVISALVVYP